jgi:guanylate kinase
MSEPPTSNSDNGLLVVVSSPSGAGKTTLCHRLMEEFDRIAFSVSYTTRAPRGTEQEGVDYHFVSEEQFTQMVEEDRFAEWARVHDNRYGTARATVEAILRAGRDLIFDIDWQGGVQLKQSYPDETVMIFVLPPSMRELSRRLYGRKTDAPDVVRRRLDKAAEELAHYEEYHYLLLNDDLERAYLDFRAIYRAARLTRPRQAHRVIALLDEVKLDGTGSS